MDAILRLIRDYSVLLYLILGGVFPLVRSAAALLTEVVEGDDPAPAPSADAGPASNFGAPV